MAYHTARGPETIKALKGLWDQKIIHCKYLNMNCTFAMPENKCALPTCHPNRKSPSARRPGINACRPKKTKAVKPKKETVNV